VKVVEEGANAVDGGHPPAALGPFKANPIGLLATSAVGAA